MKIILALIGANMYAAGIVIAIPCNHLVIGCIVGVIGLLMILFQTED